MDNEFNKLKAIIADVLNLDPDEITEDMRFVEDLGADSLDLFQVVMGLEGEFDIKVPMERVENIKTVGEALEMLRREVGISE